MSEKQPNILVIYADQMRYDCMACSGNPDITPPYLDRLAGEGVMFDNALSPIHFAHPFGRRF